MEISLWSGIIKNNKAYKWGGGWILFWRAFKERRLDFWAQIEI
jgi:hypothetical protein